MTEIPILQNKITIPYLLFLFKKEKARKFEILDGIGVSPTTATLYHKIIMRNGLTYFDPDNRKYIKLTKKGIQLCRTLLICKDICEEALDKFEIENPDLKQDLTNKIEKKQKKMSKSKQAADKLSKIFD